MKQYLFQSTKSLKQLTLEVEKKNGYSFVNFLWYEGKDMKTMNG